MAAMTLGGEFLDDLVLPDYTDDEEEPDERDLMREDCPWDTWDDYGWYESELLDDPEDYDEDPNMY
jgi:hypothetical protein